MIELKKMPTSESAKKIAIHRWFNFVAGYSPEYVELVIENYRKKNGKSPMKIYDPFAGSGTTNVVANALDIKSIGVERNPFFYKIGKAKVNASRLRKVLPRLILDFRNKFAQENKNGLLLDFNPFYSWSDDAEIFLRKLFNEKDLAILYSFKEIVEDYPENSIEYLGGYLFVSKLLEYVTYAKTDGIYKVPTSKKSNTPVSDAIDIVEDIFLTDFSQLNGRSNESEYIYDSSVDYSLDSESIDLVIFSPPYLNNFDFAEMTRMQMYFWGEADSWGDISNKHRNHMIINTTTALKSVRSKEIQNNMKNDLPKKVQSGLKTIVDALEDIRKENSRKKDYYLMVYPYFYQMQAVIKKCFEGLKRNGEIHIVVSDAAFYGIHVDTQEYLKQIMESVGFSNCEIIRMRDRGDRWVLEKRKNSGKQLGEFEIVGEKI